MTINHELCSELLGSFLRGELDDERRREVEAHVASCEGCRAELSALEALKGAEVEPLSELESARLRRDVWAAVGARDSRPARKPLGARLVPYLGTAAVLALFAVGAVTLSGGGDDDGSGDTAQVESLDALEDQDSFGTDAEAGAIEEGTRTDATAEESPLANDSSALEVGQPGTGDAAGTEGETLSQAFDATAKRTLDLGCAIGVGAP